ncbi:MAG: methylmalonyl-CoA mutase family protein [Acidimicrobiales bacterium]
MTASPLALGAEFPTPDHAEWLELAENALRGRSIDSLRTHTVDGITVEPLYTAADLADRPSPGLPGLAPFVRGTRAAGAVVGGWDVRQHIACADAAEQNEAVLAGLAAGATSVWIRVDDPASLARMVEGVLFDLAPVALDAGHVTGDAARRLVELWKAGDAAPGDIGGSFRADPIGLLARTGVLASPLDQHFDELVALIDLARPFPRVRALAVDATVYADAGASEADELACSLAAAVDVLRALTQRGLSVSDVAAQLEFTYSATADQFATMAKLRAARRLWARVVEASGGADADQRQVQHVVSAPTMLTRRDPWVNLLRVTIATFAAGVAGADSVTAAPFDSALGQSDELGRRLAGNTQALLLEESGLARVIDPAGGSWYVESLTDELAQQAWARFQEIEAEGGLVAELRSGALGRRLHQTWTQRLDGLASRATPITGVSEFPDLGEVPLHRADLASRPEPESVGDRVEALPLRRLAGPFERLRDLAAATAPTVFCANLGSPAVHTARTSWATNFFAVGGIEAQADDSYPDAAAAAAAFGNSGSQLAVICSSDALYADHAAETATALSAAGARRVYLAGSPGEARAALEQAGVDEFIHMGVDVLASLRRAHQALGTLPTEEPS